MPKVIELVTGDGASVYTFGYIVQVIYTCAFVYVLSPWHMCFYTGRYILCCFDIEEAMVALLKTLSPLQITEVEKFTRYLTDKIMQRKKNNAA